mmetsp:Transcript_28398/g.54101  ORF Transcript_28398/g.54101 Transcript_28398/m.54101 type:complete len:312 (-) Transcript_28398:142-1077(-)|eukprot:CAMPEP_0114224506 /NCGR_PEP_ID=MMETSP0058-20121206/146_1 /TAXON_ID=36894 /ORGANISM="Pyramimonas parkeae, CCMP726" /LENGTH=311 /DNA_ID=CAMNT_0001334991 /DNA_START=94 /DNA_END=1029 /DNA_ORIENTATION=+
MSLFACCFGSRKPEGYEQAPPPRGDGPNQRPHTTAPAPPIAERNNLNKNKNQRQETWALTGMVSLRDARLKELPREALNLGAKVKVLDAANNVIGYLPPGIGDCVQMTRLVLSQNKITTLPTQIGQLHALKVLVLDFNVITSLPEEIGHLIKLEKLNLAKNELRSLPSSMSNLCQLKELNISNNLITILPPTLGQCKAMESITANNNALLELPAELGGMKRLKELFLDSNGIATVPSEIFAGCTSLQTLSLHTNPVSEDVLAQVPGYTAFRDRLKAKHDKQIDGGVMLSKKGLDDGLDHNTNNTKIVVPHT